MTAYQYTTYGTKTHSEEVAQFVEHILRANLDAEARGKRKTPICIWGRHGIGKTELVEAIARRNNYQWAYIAPAQFEEMGDLVGMPAVEDGKTVFRAPAWVPDTPGPGVLLIDDVNRADDRILRGIMQLLQNFELVSWRLPQGWQIVLTANPDGGDYSVTPMDAAMLTRMMHVTMEFDVKAWARWAEASGVDPRGVNFVLTYPEVVTGERTTPRSLVQFFETIQGIEDLKGELGLIRILADSCLDEQTAAAFIAFVQQNLGALPSPDHMLSTKNFAAQVEGPIRAMVQQQTLRVDILATLCTRLVNHLTLQDIKPTKEQIDNIKSFIKMEFLPNDLRYTLAQDLVSSANKNLKVVMADPVIAKLLLQKM
jgi:hypothetical protein